MFGSIIKSGADVAALVVLFGVTIFVHELGHFLVARWCGMVVDTFSLGFGPALWKRKVGRTTYKIGCIPFGGYVALPQLDPSGMAAIQGTGEADAGQSLPAISPWKRIAVSLAGVTGNLIFGIVLAWIIYWSPEAPTPDQSEPPVIGYVDTNSVTWASGVRPGDEIVAINGEKVKTWNEVAMLCLLGTGRTNEVRVALRSPKGPLDLTLPTTRTELEAPMVDGIGKSMACLVVAVMPDSAAAAAGMREGDLIRVFDGVIVASHSHFVNLVQARGEREVAVDVERAGQTIKLRLTPRYSEVYKKALVGVTVESEGAASAAPWMQYREPMAQIQGDASMIGRTLRALVTPKEARQAARNLGGPVMIFAALWISIKISMLNAIGFLRFLNVNLAILNLLPIPVLDGGHIVFALWEGLTRRRVHPKLVNALVNVFAALLIGVLVLLSVRDIIRAPKLLRAFGLLKAQSVATNAPEDTATEPVAEPATDATGGK